MTLFPKSRVHDYLLLYPLPDDLDFLNNLNNPSTIDELINYSQTLIKFLEINKVYGEIYLAGSALFESLFSKFAYYYRQQSHLRQASDRRFELIRLEQTIHLLNSSIGTQDVSGYLGLVDENCDNSKIIQLLLLLYKKFDFYYEGYSGVYASFVSFLVPYLQWVNELKFEYPKLLSNMENEEVIHGLVKKHMVGLREALAKRKVNIQVEEERLADWGYVKEKLEEIKGLILNLDVKKDEKYYQELGMYSFLVHLGKFVGEKDLTLMKICMIASMYLGNNYKKVFVNSKLEATFKGLTNLKDMPKTTISGLEKIDLKIDFVPEMLRILIKKKQDKTLDIEERMSWLELLCCTLNLINSGQQAIKNFGAYLRTEGEGEQQQGILLEELIDLVHTNEIVLKIKDAPFYAGYMRYYDYLVFELLILGERLCGQVVKETNEWKLINKIMIDKLMQKINPEELKGIVQERYYARIQDVDFTAFKVENFARLVQAKDKLNLVRNLNHTQKLLLNDSAKHVANAEVCACLLQAFKYYKMKIGEEIKELEELEVLKNIGIFFLGLMNMKIPGLEEIKEEFVIALLGFLGQKCQLNKWDIFNLQRSLGIVLYKFKGNAKIWKEKALYQLIAQIEGEIGSSGKTTKVLLNVETLMKDEEIKEKIFEIVVPSIEGIEKGLLELWGNSPQIWEINENSKGLISRIREYCRRYIFYTLPWTSCISKGLRRNNEKDKEKLLWTLNKVVGLSFHPAFTLFLYASERRMLLESLSAIIQCSSWTRWTASLVYCRVIKEQINALESLETGIRQEFIKETRYSGVCLPAYKENKVYSQNINRSIAEFHSLMNGISELSGIFHWVENCPLEEKQQEEILEGVKGLLETVWGFVGEFNKEFRGERFEEHNEKIKQGIAVIIKSFNKMEKSYGIFYESFYEVLSQALKNCENDEALMEFLGYVLKNVGGEIQRKSLMYFVSSLGLWEPMLLKMKETKTMKGFNEIFSVEKGDEKALTERIQEMVELQGMNGTIAKEYIKTLFEKIDKELGLVSFWDIILKKDLGLKNVFYSILKTYEECFVFLLREKEENIEDIKSRFYEKVEQGIQIYPFLITKGEESEVEKVNQCQQKAKLRIVRTVYEYCLGLVKSKRPERFVELAGRNDDIVGQNCEIEKANNYLRYLRVILNHEDKKEIEFDMPLDTLFWSIYEAGVVIIQEVSVKDLLSEEFKGVVQETLELLLPYFMNGLSEKKDLKKQCEAIYKLVGLIYEAHEKIEGDKWFICPNGDLFRNLMKMLLVAFYSDRETGIEILLGEKSLLKSLLEVKSRSTWRSQAVDIVLLMFNAFIEESLPSELMAEMRIKQLLLSVAGGAQCKLTDLAKDPWVQDLEKTSETSLIQLLEKKFKVESNIQDVNDKNRYNVENLVVLLNEEKEEKDGQKKIEEILNKQSRQAQRALKMLIEVFIKNPESGILNVIFGLFNKYRHLALTGAFQKEDYLAENLTFMECLFKLDYQAQHIEDTFNLMNVFGSYTRVVFLDSNGTLVDASLVLINKFLELTRKDLQEKSNINEKEIPSPKDYMRIINAIRILGYLSSQTCKVYQGELYQKYIRSGAMKLLRVILCVLGRSRRLYEEIVKQEGANFIDILVKQLGGLYEERIVRSGLTKEKIEELKQDHYEKFLEEKEVEKHEDFVKFGEYKRQEAAIVNEITRGLEVFKGGEKVNLLRVPVRKESGVSVDEDWEGAIGNVIGDLKNLQEIYKKNEKEGAEMIEKRIEDLKKRRTEYFGQESGISEMFSGHVLDCVGAFVVKKEVEKEEEKEDNRFYVKMSNELKKVNGIKDEPEEEKKEVEEQRAEEEKVSESQGEKQEVVEEKKVEKEEQQEQEAEIQLKYFGNVNITERKQFDGLRRKVNRALKSLSERVQVRILHSEQNQQQSDIEIITQEILEERGLMTKYEQNLMSCLGGQLETLREAFNGPEVDEMKVEMTWIEENFDKYLEILEKSNENNEVEEFNDEEVKEEEPGFLFEEGFEFCTEHPERAPSIFGKIEPKKAEWIAKAAEVNGVFLVDEEVVDSIMGLLSHCKYEETLAKDTNKLTVLLRELCNCAKFELQFIDLALFLLYCPEGVKNYQQFASNILQFFSYYLQRKEYLLYQPRVYLERHGHQGIKESKKKSDFMKKTSCMVSICDLLIGLLTVKEIISSPELLKETEDLLTGILSKVGNKMKIIDLEDGQELREEQRVMTSKTCNRIFGLSKIDTVIKSVSEASIYGFKRLFRLLGTKIEILNSIIEETNYILKNKIKIFNEKPTPNDIKTVLENLPSLAGLDELLGSVSNNVAPWFLNKTEVEEQAGGFSNIEERDKVYHKIIQSIDNQILKEKLTEDFILRLYELAAYLQVEDADSAQFKIVIGSILGICLHFYALVCIRDAYNKLQIHQNKENSMAEGEFPNLTKMLSTDSQGELKELPELSQTFSHFRASRQFDYDLLFSDLVKKNRDLLSQMAYEDLNKFVPKYEILVICRRRPWILDFSSKKRILAEKILEDMRRIGSRAMRTINIDRSQMIESTIAEFSNVNLCTMRKKIKIEFLEEAGSDAGGLTREYFSVINRDLFDSKKGLFQLSANMASIQPNPLAKIVPSYLRLLELAGIMLAKAIQHECVVDVTLTKPLLKHILNRRLNINDLDDVDPELRKSLKWMLENSVEGLEQSFSYETEIFGQKITRELVADGYSKTLTDENKKEFVKSLCERKMKGEIQEELDAFLKGFYLIIPAGFLSLFSVSELQLLISGIPVIDIEEMKKYAKYIGYSETDPQIIWLWEIFGEFSQKELAAFVFFTSGSMKLSHESLKDRPFRYRKAGYGIDKLPISHTCSWEIEIPPYESKEDMRQKFMLAIFEGQESFMLN